MPLPANVVYVCFIMVKCVFVNIQYFKAIFVVAVLLRSTYACTTDDVCIVYMNCLLWKIFGISLYVFIIFPGFDISSKNLAADYKLLPGDRRRLCDR